MRRYENRHQDSSTVPEAQNKNPATATQAQTELWPTRSETAQCGKDPAQRNKAQANQEHAQTLNSRKHTKLSSRKQQQKAPPQKGPPPKLGGALADHFAVFQARRNSSPSQLRHDLYAKEVGQPAWIDNDASAAAPTGWNNAFGGLGNKIALQQPPPRKCSADASDKSKSTLLVIDLSAPQAKEPDPAAELRKARAEQAAKTAAAWRAVRATYNGRAARMH